MRQLTGQGWVHNPGPGTVFRACVVNADDVLTVAKTRLIRRVGPLAPDKLLAVEDALRVALAL